MFWQRRKKIAIGSVCWFIPFRSAAVKGLFSAWYSCAGRLSNFWCAKRLHLKNMWKLHVMPGCGMEPKHFVSWRTDVFMRKAFAVGEHVKSICAWPSICLSSYPHQFIWRLPHLLYVSSKERVMPKNVCLILNSLVQCRISLFCFATGLEYFGSWERTIYFHNLRIGYLDLSRNKSDMPCACSYPEINVFASVSFAARLWHGTTASLFVEDGSVHVQSVCSGRTCEMDVSFCKFRMWSNQNCLSFHAWQQICVSYLSCPKDLPDSRALSCRFHVLHSTAWMCAHVSAPTTARHVHCTIWQLYSQVKDTSVLR